jgi:hypothetical protein
MTLAASVLLFLGDVVTRALQESPRDTFPSAKPLEIASRRATHTACRVQRMRHSGAGDPMSDSRKYLLGATATIVAARIAARAQVRPGGDLQKPVPEPSLKDEFLATYRELEEAFVALGEASPQKAYGDKPRKRENESLLGD